MTVTILMLAKMNSASLGKEKCQRCDFRKTLETGTRLEVAVNISSLANAVASLVHNILDLWVGLHITESWC